MVTMEQFQSLQGTQGMALLAEIAAADSGPTTEFALATRLRREYPADLVSAALTMHHLRRRAAGRFPEAQRLWFTRAGLEQSTAQAIARYRAARYDTVPHVYDLCCGIGGDLLGLLQELPAVSVTAVDRDPLHLVMAAANAAVVGGAGRVTILEADVRELDLLTGAGVFIDPARRTERGRLAHGESEPPLAWCVGLAAGARPVGIKAAPGLDHAVVPRGWEFEAIAIGTDLKEAMLWSPALASSPNSATVLAGDRVNHLAPHPGDAVPRRDPRPGDVLIDPNPAITRSGLVADLARSLPGRINLIDRQIGFLLADQPIETPFGRTLRIVDSLPWHEKRLKARLRELDAGPVDVRRRGLAGDVDAIAKRLRGRGAHPFTIAMTRVDDRPWALVCQAEVTGG